MALIARRDVLKLLGAGALTASCALTRKAAAAIPELRYRPEQGARLRFVRWRNLDQGDDDQWMANTRKFTEQTGVPVQVENISLEEVWAKTAVSANIGAGPDIVMGAGGQPQLYADKCLDLTELADYLAAKYGGWYDAVRACCVNDNRWIAVGMGFSTACVVYRQSMAGAAGFSDIPRDLPGFLNLCQALKARGTPPGLALGNAPVDATIWCHWLIWTHGARLVDEHNRVAINSEETIAALEYAKQLYPTFVPGTLSWLDASNNQAFLTGQISLTYNAISIYHFAKTSTAPGLKAIAEDIQHVHLPIGPVGRPTELALFAPGLDIQLHAFSERRARIFAFHAGTRAIRDVAESIAGLLLAATARLRVRPDLDRRFQGHPIPRWTGHDPSCWLRGQGGRCLCRLFRRVHRGEHGGRSRDWKVDFPCGGRACGAAGAAVLQDLGPDRPSPALAAVSAAPGRLPFPSQPSPAGRMRPLANHSLRIIWRQFIFDFSG